MSANTINLNPTGVADNALKATFVGTGLGTIAAGALRISAGGALFGAVYALASKISLYVSAFLVLMVGGYKKGEKISTSKTLVILGATIPLQSIIAFGVTALFISGFTFSSALYLSSVMFTVDVISIFTLGHGWTIMEDKKKEFKNGYRYSN